MESQDLFGVVREPSGSRSPTPVLASTARRYGAAAIDGALAIVAGALSGLLYLISKSGAEVPSLSGGVLSGRILAVCIGFSLVNQVMLTAIFRGSVGKLIVGTRVVRLSDGGRASPIRLLLRWIGGIAYGLTILPLALLLDGTGTPPPDFAGVCITYATNKSS